MRNTKWYAGAMLVVTAVLGALILLPRPEKARAISPETCVNGTDLEHASINWIAGQLGGNNGDVVSCANDPAFPASHNGNCKSTYGLICARTINGVATWPEYRVAIGELCLGDAAHRKIVNDLYYKTSPSDGWHNAPYPNDPFHCTCNAGGSGATCNWQ